MEKQHVGFDLTIYEGEEALPSADRELLERARSATSGAYAPYSGFRVGAALMLQSGEVIIGSNQENASFPSGLCGRPLWELSPVPVGIRTPSEKAD